MEKIGKILVVDDEKSICENVEKILAKNNFQVIKALSAKEALEKMASESISLLISDIVMPETNGLELLKMVKKQWPFVKVLMMTAYASIDTAVKAIRLGALDYLPKPFTPDELRASVDKALSGELMEAPVSEKERDAIEAIDVDIPFDKNEVAKAAGEEYADKLGPSDMPLVEGPLPETLENYCVVGEQVCDIFKKLGDTCKAGSKTGQCPKLKKAKNKERAGKGFDARVLISVDIPFNVKDVEAITGPEYVRHVGRDGSTGIYYEDLKENVALMMEEQEKRQSEKKKEAAVLKIEDAILVVDDEPAVNNNIRKILAKKGYSVEQALTKEEALEKISQRYYRLVLLDLKMPGVRGLELLKAIKEIRPETMVIIITGYASIETAVETARLGAIDYLAKPFTPAEIREVTEKAFQLAA